MKAAIVMPLAHQRGGAELALLHLLRAERGNPQVKYTLAFLEEGPLVEEAEALGYEVRVIAVGRLRQLTRYVQGVLALAAWLRRERVGVVMSWMAKAHLYAAPAACLAGTPSVWWQHGVPGTHHWLDRLATRLPARAVFCCSNASQQAQQALSPSRPTRVIYPAVDLERFDPGRLPTPTEARSRLGLPTQGPLVGILARLQRWKGLFVFLEAAARVARVNPEARFAVVGGPHFDEPALHAELVEQAKRTGILGRVCFAGHQNQTKIPLWIQALDVVVNASIDEPFGMTIIESMALGKAVIATRQGGPIEIIDDGKDGLLIQPGDPAALASSILRLTKDAENRSAIGNEARRRAQQFGTGRFASELAQHLTQVIR